MSLQENIESIPQNKILEQNEEICIPKSKNIAYDDIKVGKNNSLTQFVSFL